MVVGARDYPGGAVVACVLREQPQQSVLAAAGINHRLSARGLEPSLEVIELVQTDVIFSEAVELAAQVCRSPELSFLMDAGQVGLIVDVSEASERTALQVYGLPFETLAATLVNEDVDNWGGPVTRLSRAGVFTALVELLHSGRIQIPRGLKLAETLETDLNNTTITGAEEASALVTAVALIAWQASESAPTVDDFGGPDDDLTKWGLGRE